MSIGSTDRLLALEGLRGVAAIVVTFYHAFLIFWPLLILGQDTANPVVEHTTLESVLYGLPTFALYSGVFAVSIFFVLSGFVLSINFFTTGKMNVIRRLAAKRYLRLMLPALASVMVAWLLITVGLSHNAEAHAVTQSYWLSLQWNFEPHFFEALGQGIWGVFTGGPTSYNGVLWTMVYELIGSFLVFFTVMLFGAYPRRWIVYILLLFITFQTWYIGFVIGMILADLYAHRKFIFNGKPTKLSLLFLTLGIVIGSYPLGTVEGTIYETMMIPGLQNVSFYTAIGAALVIISVLTIPRVSKLLSSKVLSTLGKYTYSLYLVHMLVLFTLCTGLFLWFRTFMDYNWAALASIAVTLPVIALGAFLFERYVDSPSIKLSGKFADWLLQAGKKTISK